MKTDGAYKALRKAYQKVVIDRDMWKLEFELLAAICKEKNEEIEALLHPEKP